MPEVHTIDLSFQGEQQVIAAFAARTGDGLALIETGPQSCARQLIRALGELGCSVGDLEGILVTHIHLDHAGGAGSLARLAGCPVWVHPEGAIHLADPSKLLASAERLYKDEMETLWGRTVAVPPELIRVAEHGERVRLGSATLTAHHTPGHAIHHIAWQIGSSVATGDVGGVRFPGASHVSPPTPPPDIQVEAWRHSINQLRQLEPEQLLLTHFGAFDDVGRHLDELDARLVCWTDIAERSTSAGHSRAELAAELAAVDTIDMQASGARAEMRRRYEQLCPMAGNAAGLHRYWDKRREAES